MRYLLLIYATEQEWVDATPERVQRVIEAHAGFTQSIQDSGHYLGGEALELTSQATTVRVRDGETLTTDGPFAETREQLGGYYLIDAPDLGAAVEIAARVPEAATGSIEVRPITTIE
jgi:hypothetical protein